MTRAAALASIAAAAATLAEAPQAQQQFGPAQPVSVNTQLTGPRTTIAADLDGDGDFDVVSGTSGQSWDRIVWYENLGAGLFGPKQFISGNINDVRQLRAGDLDADGDVDVAYASWGWSRLAWYENLDGAGTFAGEELITTALPGHDSLALADLDGDGDLDVLGGGRATFQEETAWFPNDGTGVFLAKLSIAARGVQVAASDLDGDGDLDVLSGSDVDRDLGWSRNLDGQGLFGLRTVIDAKLTSYASVPITPDIDGDGDLDLAVAYNVDDRIAWYANLLGEAVFGEPQVVDTNVDGAWSLAEVDVDVDGDADLVAAILNDDLLAWYDNTDGGGAYGPAQVVEDGNARPFSVDAADMDGDGVVDVVSEANGDGQVVVVLNQGGSFADSILLEGGGPGQPSAVALADLDGDMDLDGIVSSSGDGEISTFENTDGQGTFGPQVIVEAFATAAEDVAAADLDGDGDTDLLWAAQFGNEVAWRPNLGGTFGPKWVLGSPVKPVAVAAEDLDGDGDREVLTNSVAGLAWAENIGGAGTFAPLIFIESVSTTDGVTAADLDGDGLPDPVYVVSAAGEVAWNPNLGGGAFAPRVVASGTLTSPRDVFPADLDGDGDLDLAACSAGDEIAWIENLGGGVFGPDQVLTTFLNAPESIVAADFDADGDQDLLFHTNGIGPGWLENTDGLGTFGFPAGLSVGPPAGTGDVAAGDISGDGIPDAFSCSAATSVVEWYASLGACGGPVAGSEVSRVGTPPNPDVLLPGATGPPTLGTVWDPRIDHTGFFPGATVDFLGVTTAAANVPLPPYGTLLCDTSNPPLYLFNAAPGAPFNVPVFGGCHLVGLSLCAQGISSDGVQIQLTNALDVTLGTL